MEESQFRQALATLTELAAKQTMCISEEQIAEQLGDMMQNEEQKKLLLDYFKSKRISVGDKAELDELLSMEEKDYLEEYISSLETIERIADAELSEIMKSAVAGDELAREIVLRHFLPQTVELARLYAGQGILIEDLIGEGNLALYEGVGQLGCLEATDKIAEEMEGFLGKYMMDAMERLINGEAEEKNSDEKMLEKVNRVADAARELSEIMQRKVAPEEVAAESELTLDEVLEAMRLSADKIEAIESET
jgi:RNA polymerase primary sigma factor